MLVKATNNRIGIEKAEIWSAQSIRALTIAIEIGKISTGHGCILETKIGCVCVCVVDACISKQFIRTKTRYGKIYAREAAEPWAKRYSEMRLRRIIERKRVRQKGRLWGSVAGAT